MFVHLVLFVFEGTRMLLRVLCFLSRFNPINSQVYKLVSFLCQLIYKKTILPCPLPFFYQHDSNMSVNGTDALGMFALQNASALAYISETAVNGPHLDPHGPVHDSTVQYTARPEDAEDMCTPKYFVFNSQVTIQM